MKKAILILALAFIGGFIGAQTTKESDVPSAVKKTFFTKYPNIKVDKWEKKKTDYLAKFDENSTATCVVIDEKGNWVKTRAHIDPSMLPKTANDYMEKTYPGKKITEASQVNHPSGKLSYEAEVGETIIYFDAGGNFVSAEKEK
jgi:hypothetical protein